MNVLTGSAQDEVAEFFPADGETLFGILTFPKGKARGVGVVLLSGGGTPISTNVNRLSVVLGRSIASLGFHAFRFDYHGVGESTGNATAWHLGSPFVADLRAALDLLRRHGIDRFVLVGSCFGARTCLATAALTTGVEAVILVSAPVRDFEMGSRTATRLATELGFPDYLRLGLQPRTWRNLGSKRYRRLYRRVVLEQLRKTAGRVSSSDDTREARYRVSPRFVRPLRALVDRGTPILLIYGDEDDLFREFALASEGPLAEIVGVQAAGVSLQVIQGPVHGFRRMDAQEEVRQRIVNWLVSLYPAPSTV